MNDASAFRVAFWIAFVPREPVEERVVLRDLRAVLALLRGRPRLEPHPLRLHARPRQHRPRHLVRAKIVATQNGSGPLPSSAVICSTSQRLRQHNRSGTCRSSSSAA
jgi:hypothetical protein